MMHLVWVHLVWLHLVWWSWCTCAVAMPGNAMHICALRNTSLLIFCYILVWFPAPQLRILSIGIYGRARLTSNTSILTWCILIGDIFKEGDLAAELFCVMPCRFIMEPIADASINKHITLWSHTKSSLAREVALGVYCTTVDLSRTSQKPSLFKLLLQAVNCTVNEPDCA